MANPAKYILQKLRLAKNRTKPVGIMSDKFAKLPKKLLAQGHKSITIAYVLWVCGKQNYRTRFKCKYMRNNISLIQRFIIQAS